MQPRIRGLLVNQGEATYFNSDIFLFQFYSLFNLQRQTTPSPPSPNLLLFPTICYEHLVYHCSLGNDLGSLPSYYILIFIWFGYDLDQTSTIDVPLLPYRFFPFCFFTSTRGRWSSSLILATINVLAPHNHGFHGVGPCGLNNLKRDRLRI